MQTQTVSAEKKLTHGSVFGPFSRYQLLRHESHRGPEFSMWFVQDAEKIDAHFVTFPAVIRQAFTIEEAVKGLEIADVREVE